MLASLGFVFSALVEFTIIIALKRRAVNKMVRTATKPSSWKKKIMDANQGSGIHGKLNAATAKYQGSMFGQELDDDDKFAVEEADMALLRKIDFISFLAYLSGYILFNFYYWVDMITKE